MMEANDDDRPSQTFQAGYKFFEIYDNSTKTVKYRVRFISNLHPSHFINYPLKTTKTDIVQTGSQERQGGQVFGCHAPGAWGLAKDRPQDCQLGRLRVFPVHPRLRCRLDLYYEPRSCKGGDI